MLYFPWLGPMSNFAPPNNLADVARSYLVLWLSEYSMVKAPYAQPLIKLAWAFIAEVKIQQLAWILHHCFDTLVRIMKPCWLYKATIMAGYQETR